MSPARHGCDSMRNRIHESNNQAYKSGTELHETENAETKGMVVKPVVTTRLRLKYKEVL